MHVVHAPSTTVNRKAKDFCRLVFNECRVLAGENEEAVNIVLAAMESNLADLARAPGGRTTEARTLMLNAMFDELIDLLSGLVGGSARAAVCMALLAMGESENHLQRRAA